MSEGTEILIGIAILGGFYLACFFSIINSALYYTYFWQLKEYRFDRMGDFLKSKSGREKFFHLPFLIKYLALFIAILTLVYFDWVLPGRIPGLAIWQSGQRLEQLFEASWQTLAISAIAPLVIEIVDFLIRAKQHKIYRPARSAKAYLIVLLTIVSLGVAAWFGRGSAFELPFLLLILSCASPIIAFLWVSIFKPVTSLSKTIILAVAKNKVAKMKDLKVIGITGSYGKSSVKEILAQILGSKFQVLKTPGNTNTEIGVAGIVLKHLKSSDKVFIVECGAYKVGEIKKITQMISPQIGIITAVRDAHLAMFGSLENIKKAKFELIESLPDDGIAIFNGENEGSADLANRATKLKLGKVIRYGLGNNDLVATEVEENVDGLKFKVKGIPFEAPILGQHNVLNILAATAAAMAMGLTLEEIAVIVRKIKLRDHTLSLLKPNEGLIILDDTYNANPDGVMAGLHVMSLYKDWQKIIVFPGMLELGERSEPEHKRVGEKMAEVCDFVYLTSRDFEEPLLASFQEKKFSDFEFVVEDQQKLLELLKPKIANRKTVLLLVSRGCEIVLKKLQK